MKHNIKSEKLYPGKQRGLALVTAMVFLIILSIIGVSAMRGSAMEQRMTTYHSQALQAFHHAESGLSAAVKDLAAHPSKIRGVVGGTPVAYAAFSDTEPAGPVSASTAYQWKRPHLGYSIAQDSGFIDYYFEITSRGRDGNSSSTNRQGISILGLSDSFTR